MYTDVRLIDPRQGEDPDPDPDPAMTMTFFLRGTRQESRLGKVRCCVVVLLLRRTWSMWNPDEGEDGNPEYSEAKHGRRYAQIVFAIDRGWRECWQL